MGHHFTTKSHSHCYPPRLLHHKAGKLKSTLAEEFRKIIIPFSVNYRAARGFDFENTSKHHKFFHEAVAVPGDSPSQTDKLISLQMAQHGGTRRAICCDSSSPPKKVRQLNLIQVAITLKLPPSDRFQSSSRVSLYPQKEKEDLWHLRD
ncbi:unnamed protein product [Caretta caretta]